MAWREVRMRGVSGSVPHLQRRLRAGPVGGARPGRPSAPRPGPVRPRRLAPENTAYARVTNIPTGLATHDLYGSKRAVAWDERRTSHDPIPLGQSPIYLVGPKGLKLTARPNPGW